MKKGNYIDEKIILQRRNAQKGTGDYNLLTDEIPIRGKRIRFQWFPLFHGEFRILLPEDFVQMPEHVAKDRYIFSCRPPLILTCPDYDENFGFHLLEDENAGLDDLVRKMKDAVLLHAPETVVYDEGTIEPDQMEGRWFEYKNFTIDDETYNMQFLIRSGSSLLAGTFNCRMVFFDQWKPLVFKSLELIERTGKERGADESR